MSWLVPSLPTWARATPASSSTTPIEEDDVDAPPPFPLLNSHQRSSAPAPSFSVAPPSPKKSLEDVEPPSDLNIAISDSPLGNMAPPPSTVKKPSFGIQTGGSDPSAQEAKGAVKKKRAKVALTPGHSALDWARLTSSGEDLRGVSGFQRVTMAELKEASSVSTISHNTPDDAWSAFNGMVYNITPYLPFHPGGEDELMRVAGRDGTKLFMLTHSWVNMDFMLKECMVGVLVRG